MHQVCRRCKNYDAEVSIMTQVMILSKEIQMHSSMKFE